MTDNPLMLRQPDRPGRETKESLEAYAAELNGMNWVRASGKPYFVNKRTDETGVKHFLDRMV